MLLLLLMESSLIRINHISLAEEGEGAQLRELVCQYDQAGAYVGNSDIFQVSGSLASIGQKIKAALFSDLETEASFLSSAACAVFIGNDTFPIAVFMLGAGFYIYNLPNQTWMKFNRITDGAETQALTGVTYLPTADNYLQSALTVGECSLLNPLFLKLLLF